MKSSENIRWKYLAGLLSESQYKKINENNDEFNDLEIDDVFYYKYNSFQEFLDAEFGADLTDDEIVEAIQGWANAYNIGENPGDFEGLADIVTPVLMEKLKLSGVSNAFLSELQEAIKYNEENPIPAVAQNLNDPTPLQEKIRN